MSDKSVNLTQDLLNKQFPEFGGFIETCLGKTQHFNVVPKDKPYIQILHTGTLYHKSKSTSETHHLYDGLSRPLVMDNIVKQIASYSYCQSTMSEMSIYTESVQQQKKSHLIKCLKNTMEEFSTAQNKKKNKKKRPF